MKFPHCVLKTTRVWIFNVMCNAIFLNLKQDVPLTMKLWHKNPLLHQKMGWKFTQQVLRWLNSFNNALFKLLSQKQTYLISFLYVFPLKTLKFLASKNLLQCKYWRNNKQILCVKFENDTYTIHSLTIKWYHSMCSITHDQTLITPIVRVALEKEII